MLFTNNIRKLFISILLSYHFKITRCTLKTVSFYSNSSMNDKVCVNSAKISQVASRSKIYCTQLCNNCATCTSVQYHSGTATCTLCSGNNDLEEQQGTVFYYKQSMYSSYFTNHTIRKVKCYLTNIIYKYN